jgi:hypothetical protein
MTPWDAFGDAVGPIEENGHMAAPRLLGAVALAASLGFASGARADEADAKRLMKAMSDYMAKQTIVSFGFDSSLEIVTKDHQKLMLASSGKVELSRPDKIRSTRDGGFSDVEMVFDGKTLTVVNKDANEYAQADVPGTLDNLVDELREKFHKPVPGADLLMSNIYDQLMPLVTDIKDLGTGVVGGTKCDHLAFRNQDVDWQIWIAQGDRPYPCRYVITAKQVDQAPQYTVQVRDWKTGGDTTAAGYEFTNATNARKVDVSGLGDIDELPGEYTKGTTQ